MARERRLSIMLVECSGGCGRVHFFPEMPGGATSQPVA